MRTRLRRLLFGNPVNIQDPKVYHQISLIAFRALAVFGES